MNRNILSYVCTNTYLCPGRPQIRVNTSSYGERVNFCAILATSLDVRSFDCLKCSGNSC